MFKISSIKTKMAAALALAGAFAIAPALAQSSRTLQSVDFLALDGERVLLTLTLSEPAPEPVVFTIDKPARLSLDLADTRLGVPDRFKKIGIGQALSVASIEAKGRTRVVIELTELVPYNVRVDGKKVLVNIDNGLAAKMAPPQSGVATAAAASASASKPLRAAGINNIDFRRGEKGEGRVVVTLADPKTGVDVTEVGGKIVINFRGAGLPDKLQRRLEVLDFATPVKFVDARVEGLSSSITVTPVDGAEFEQVAYQTGNVFTLELQPLSAEKVEERKKQNPQFVGERVSLSFQSVDIRSLLQIIADVAGTNMVVSDSVSGEIAMRLQNVPWDQALDIILRTKGLGMRQQGNVMLVAPLEELAMREKVELESQKQNADLAPLRSEIVQVNYAKATDIAKLLKASNNSLLSARAAVTVDERTNTLIILETRDKLAELRQLIGQLDIPVRQVLIESRIVIARDDYGKQLGARFGLTAAGTRNGNLLATTGTTGGGATGNVSNRTGTSSVSGTGGMVDSFIAGGRTGPVAIPFAADRYNVNLPTAANNAGGIALAILGAGYLVDLELSALQTEGRGEVISNPRVITANGKQAYVEQGTEIPYREASSSGAATVSFKKAVLGLTVTPQITPDNRILMDLAVTNDTIGQVFDGIPTLDIRRVNTQVLVKTGETVVLGGVFEQSAQRDASKVPLLGDLPLLGNFFKNDIKSNSKRELLIFVTPKLLQQGLTVD